eukprot:gene40177-54325_t
MITSDAVRARKDATFDEVAAEVFAELPTTKLSQAEL